MWVQLLTLQNIEKDGIRRVYHPGDWVDVSKAIAARWLAAGQAISRIKEPVQLQADCGIVVLGDMLEVQVQLSQVNIKVQVRPIHIDDPSLPFTKTLFWQASVRLRLDYLPAGFGLLDRWDMAIPLISHQTLALDLATTPHDQARTESTIHDLRVPVYETGIIFSRQEGAAAETIGRWIEEMKYGGRRDLALLRAIYQVKPRILALPATWMHE